MRLWHVNLIKHLPNLQLVAQWRELNSIFKNKNKHILINYIYDYPEENLLAYTSEVIAEMKSRGIKIRSFKNFDNYFKSAGCDEIALEDYKKGRRLSYNPFLLHHTDNYLRQCFYNLQEKYERGQKDFSFDEYLKLYDSVLKEFCEKGELLI